MLIFNPWRNFRNPLFVEGVRGSSALSLGSLPFVFLFVVNVAATRLTTLLVLLTTLPLLVLLAALTLLLTTLALLVLLAALALLALALRFLVVHYLASFFSFPIGC